MRSPPPGKEMNAQRAPLDRCSSCRTTLSRLVIEPPDCLSWPGFFFAAVDEIGERLERRVGLHRDHRRLEHQARDRRQVAERHLRLAAVTSGLVSQTPVKKPMVCGSPAFSAR